MNSKNLCTPKYFTEKDQQVLLNCMHHHPFGILVTSDQHRVSTTYLPLIIEKHGKELFGISPMAKVTMQWKNLTAECNSFVIFSEPLAYISTTFYSEKGNVPTWNYAAIHTYGNPKLLKSDGANKGALKRKILTLRSPDIKTYRDLQENNLNKMLHGIAAFEIKVNDIQGTFKMSQSLQPEERKKIIEQFKSSDDTMQQAVAGPICKSSKI